MYIPIRLLVLFAALIAAPVGAATWESCSSGNADPSIAPGQSLCADLTSGDLDTVILAVGACENFDVVYNASQADTDNAITVQMMTCVSATADANACEPFDGITLDGNPPLEGIWGATAVWIWFDGSGTIGDDLPRVLVKCNGS